MVGIAAPIDMGESPSRGVDDREGGKERVHERIWVVKMLVRVVRKMVARCVQRRMLGYWIRRGYGAGWGCPMSSRLR